MSTAPAEHGTSTTGLTKVRRLPPEVSILGVLIGIALVFEVLGWIFINESFIANKQRLSIIVLQVAVIGIIAVGVTQVIITAGVDLSSGSMVGFIAMVSASFAQSATNARAVFATPEFSWLGLEWFLDSSPFWPIAVGLLLGLAARRLERLYHSKDQYPAIYRHFGHDGVGARPRQMVHARPARRSPA